MKATVIIAVFSSFAYASEPLDVRIKNFPETQRVGGSVSVDGIVSHGKGFKREGLLLQTSRRNEPSELLYAGVVDTDGFTSVSISLEGEVKSTNFVKGEIGVMLVPDEEPVLRVMRESKLVQFPIECVSPLKFGDSEYFSAQRNQQPIFFPRYRIYLYNTLNRSAETNVYLYLTN
jgi:hypothetical protein